MGRVRRMKKDPQKISSLCYMRVRGGPPLRKDSMGGKGKKITQQASK